MRGFNLQLVLDFFNVFNNQEGYNFESRAGVLGTCNPTTSATCFSTGLLGPVGYLKSNPANNPNSYYAPRRFQLAARLQF